MKKGELASAGEQALMYDPLQWDEKIGPLARTAFEQVQADLNSQANKVDLFARRRQNYRRWHGAFNGDSI